MNKPQKWLSVTVRADGSALEAVENYMFELGCSGTEDLPGAVKGYFADPWNDDLIRISISVFIADLGLLNQSSSPPHFEVIGAEDWSAGWKQYFKPVKIGSRFVVKPPWEAAADDGRIHIDINPALAFGTGTHETTQLVLEMMETRVAQGSRVLDGGTGSGLLAIGAVKLGAGSVTGFDVDPDALENAAGNAKLNGIPEQIHFICGGLDAVPKEPFDLIFANINRKVLVGLIPQFKEYMKASAFLILSGILIEDHHLIQSVLDENGFLVEKQQNKGEWEAMVVRIG